MINTNSELNNYLVIDGLKNNDFNQAFNKNLLIRNFTPDDSWDFLLKFKNIENLRVEDSYINSENFLKILLQFKNIKHLIYNHYCYFTKIKNKQALNKLSLSSLKKFTIEFPKEEEPDLDINYYSATSYKNKRNSITDINGYENIFINLEEIEFLNYNTYLERVLKNNDKEDINKLKKEIYWNVSFKKLSLLKNLKNIKIDDGKYETLLKLGLENFLNKNDSIKINSCLNLNDTYLKNIKILKFFYNEEEKNHKVFSKINTKLLENYNDILSNEIALNINEYKYYKTQGYNKKFKILKNKNYEKFINNKFETVIFSNCLEFLRANFSGTWNIAAKGELFEKFFKTQKNIRNIIFEFYKDEKSHKSWSSTAITTLNIFVSQILKGIPNINIYFYHEQTDEILKGKESKDEFKIFFNLLYDMYKNNEYKKNINFFSKDEKLLEKNYTSILNKIDQVIIVDDIIYNNSNFFPEKFLIHADDLDCVYNYFQEAYLNNAAEKYNLPGNIFYEILRIISFSKSEFEPNENALVLVIKKNKLSHYNNLKFKKVFYYVGSPGHHINQELTYNEKKWNAKKIIGVLKNNNKEGIKKVSPKIIEASKKAAAEITESKYFSSSKISKNDLLKNVEEYELISDLGLNTDQFKDLELFWLEGVNPWQQRYVELNRLDNIIPVKKLKKLRLSDCIYFKNTNLTELENIEILSLTPHENHHKKSNDNIVISGFEKLKSLKILDISRLYHFYNKELFDKTLGYTGYSTNIGYSDTYSCIDLDLSKVNQLKNLKEIKIDEITAKNISKLKSIPSIEKFDLNVFHHTIQGKESLIQIQEDPIKDQDLSFLKNSKRLHDLKLNLGDITIKDDYYGQIYSSYSGNGDFIDYINYKIKKLDLSINFKKENLLGIKDIINKISNRFFNLEWLNLRFGIATKDEYFGKEADTICKGLKPIQIDFSKFAKLTNLKSLSFQRMGQDCFIPFKTINLKSISNFKVIETIEYDWNSVDFKELREARLALNLENFKNRQHYDYDYDYYVKDEGDKEYEKNWSRSKWINTDNWDDWYSLDQRYIDAERENNKKKFKKPKLIINKK